MIKMYVMETCPDCEYIKKQVEGNPNFELIDISKHVRNLKQFIKFRDTHSAVDEAKAAGDLGMTEEDRIMSALENGNGENFGFQFINCGCTVVVW